MAVDYKEDIKRILLLYKYNPDYREEYYVKLFSRNKNKVLMAFLELFDDEINHFSYDGTEDLTYLFTLLELLPDLIRNNELLQQTTINRFTVLHREINDLIHVKPSDVNNKQNNRYKLLKNILFKMEDTILKFYYEIPPDYDSSKEEFISYLIFRSKNIHYFENAIEEFPYIVNIKDENDVPLIDKVIDAYLGEIDKYISNTNLGPIDDLIYYKKILKLMIKSDKIALNDEDKQKLIDKLNNHLKNGKYAVVRQKEKHTYFINSIIMMLLGVEEENDLINLNYEYEVHDTFKATHDLEAKRIYILNKDLQGKRKRRKIYTFDSEGAFELDDALSIEKKDGIYHLGVHIANPLAYISTDSILYDEAKKRTRSLYCGNICIPMIPFNLSGDIMSLNQGEYRHAMSHYFDIDAKNGDLIKYTVTPEIIKVTKNLTYDDFNNDIVHGSNDQAYYETIMNLTEVSNFLAKVYNEDQVYEQYHNDNSRTIGTSVVEKCMIYTNYNLAKLFSERDLPYIYRCHKLDEEEQRRIEDLKNRIPLRGDNKSVLRDLEMLKNIFPRAYYTLHNVGHEGLGTDYYSHVTSPLRRFADNVATECIYKFIVGEYTKEDIKAYQEYIEKMAEQINTKRRTLDSYEIERGARTRVKSTDI